MRDYYEEARVIARLLRQEGAAADASRLEELILAGSTATEILMGIRHHLRNLAPSFTNDELRRRVRDLVGGIDDALR